MSDSNLETENVADAASTVAVLGLGAMGLPMATRLAGAFTVRGFDINEDRRQEAEGHGVSTFGSAREAATGADAVLLAVRNEEQLLESLFGETGVAGVLPEGCVIILTSTVGGSAIPAVAERLAGSGVGLVDAPLSGGPIRAGEGDLLIVVGADPEVLARARPVLDRLSSTLIIVGDTPGDGQALKTVNQLLCGIHIAAAAEALALAAALGLDQAKALEALGAGAAASFMLANRGPRMIEEHEGDEAAVLSRLDIFVKDMGIVGRAARTAGLPAPLAASAEQVYLLAQAQGLGMKDDSAVIRMLTPRP
ncbi:NAD(P)-dependent oxidoreductase [Subtercola boreus]|uniref:Oxidoreductase n=1 Tax=Subtercola boreus TaxID=120213 RepID=A0A3E0WG75_9MICO|nr:NAD(P)-dependent oxidoreductase [Subtercola boreus]RFA23528.1 oxidoreductase [Subtercola boreus]RFA23922.1 oxidoreductase [Subtercola boreus]RFA29621.1 oxidoreductase [Subtercola boreus]